MTDGLAERIRHVARTASRRGALQPIATRCELLEEEGIRFIIRVVERPCQKDASTRHRPASFNPFLPFDPELFVADCPPSHVLLLNKFPVTDEHLLLVTRAFEPQQAPLAAADFEALSRYLTSGRLAFYNSAPAAGASQPHRHLQLVSLPLGPVRLPIAAVLPDSLPSQAPVQLDALPFVHYILGLASSAGPHIGRHWHVAYEQLMESAPSAAAYNLLCTPQWMMLIPRIGECFEGISLNALAFAGTFLVKSEDQLEQLTQAGPLAACRAVTLPRPPRHA